VLENDVLRKIFGPKSKELTGCWRKLHIKELHNLYSSQGDQMKEDEMGMACSIHWKVINAYKIFVRRPKGKRPLGRHRHIWEDNIKIDLVEIGWKGVDWIHMAHDRVQWQAFVNTVMNFQVSRVTQYESTALQVSTAVLQPKLFSSYNCSAHCVPSIFSGCSKIFSLLQAKKEIYDVKQQRLYLAQDEYNHLHNALTTLNTSRTSCKYIISKICMEMDYI
jgi:hypothetical protein